MVSIYDFKYEDEDLNEIPRIKFKNLTEEEKLDLRTRLKEIGEEFIKFCIDEITPPKGYIYLSNVDPFRKVISQPCPSVKMKIKSKSINFYIDNKTIENFGYTKKQISDRVFAEVSDGFFCSSFRWPNTFDTDPKYILWF